MGKTYKLLLEVGFTALCDHIKAIRATAEQSGSAVASLAERTAASLGEIDGLFDTKQNKVSAVSVTIPASGWGSDSTAGYPKYYDIVVSGVTASDRASVDLAPASAAAAVRCGLCPTCETLAGKIRIRANSVPAASMTANYWIEKGS